MRRLQTCGLCGRLREEVASLWSSVELFERGWRVLDEFGWALEECRAVWRFIKEAGRGW